MDKYSLCLFDAILQSLHTDHLQFRRQYTVQDLRRMLVVLMAEYWRLIVDEQFLLTIQMEYAEDEEEQAIREKRGLSRPPGPYSLRMYLHAMLRPTMCGLPSIRAADQRDPGPDMRLHCCADMPLLPPSEGGRAAHLQWRKPLYCLL